MRIVVALGGNALLKRGEPFDAEVQRKNVMEAAAGIARIITDNEVVVTHGNGPQVGLLALQSEAYPDVAPYPLDILGAESQGMIGYLIEDELRDELGGEREVATLLTQVVVDPSDSAFTSPTKPIGPVYTEATAKQLAETRGWSMARDGDNWRRAVPSPEPKRIIEINSVRLLMDAGVVVICAGGGGVPVVPDGTGGFRGVEAVVDKDLSAAMLADSINADALLLLTDIDAVYEDWSTADARPMRQSTPTRIRQLEFAAGSMGPKVEAACRFAESVTHGSRGIQRFASIGALKDIEAVLSGDAGTRISE